MLLNFVAAEIILMSCIICDPARTTPHATLYSLLLACINLENRGTIPGPFFPSGVLRLIIISNWVYFNALGLDGLVGTLELDIFIGAITYSSPDATKENAHFLSDFAEYKCRAPELCLLSWLFATCFFTLISGQLSKVTGVSNSWTV